MKHKISMLLSTAFILASVAAASIAVHADDANAPVDPKAGGTVKGAVVGGLGGAVIGHPVAGAAVGGVIGHHKRHKAEKEAAKHQAETQQPAPTQPTQQPAPQQ
jgi:uncharacterized membrane protein